ncbi:MAG: dihydroorotate dehydrogenase electron transfer subunit [Candidatus Woesearchaeota archaeon]
MTDHNSKTDKNIDTDEHMDLNIYDRHDIPKTTKVAGVVIHNPYLITIWLKGKINIKPGQFIMVWLPNIEEKPFTVSCVEKDRFSFTAAKIGKFTTALFDLKINDVVGYRGPYGNGFTLVEGKNVCIVAGGIGIAAVSLLYLALKDKNNVKLIYGAKSSCNLVLKEKICDNHLCVCTDDGSDGKKAFTTNVLEEFIKEKNKEENYNEKIDMIYTCGPEIMMKKVADICEMYNIKCEVSLERKMGCGFGICGGCTINHKLVCLDGPVFNLEQLKELPDFGSHNAVSAHRCECKKNMSINKDCNNNNTLLLKNCRILNENNLSSVDIFIEDNIIKRICKVKSDIKVDKIIDCKNMIIMPGLIDPHVHFRDFIQCYKADFLSESKAAAAGGVTTILDMPNTKPPVINKDMLEKRRKIASQDCLVNYGFYFGAANDNIDEIRDICSPENIDNSKNIANIAAVKVFMNESTGNMKIDDDKVLQQIFNSSKIIAVHAEDDMVEKSIRLSKTNKLYLCHISQQKELDVIKGYKQSQEYNQRLFVEITPHHLFLSNDDMISLGNFGLMKPNLRTKQDQDALWKAIDDDIVDTIGTDHAPHTIAEKKTDKPQYGVPGVETRLPLLLNEINRGIEARITLKKVQQLCCENPAMIIGIKNKGFIKEGYDADLVVVDMEKEKIIKNKELLTKCRWSPFEGMKLKGWPVMTIVDGSIVFDDMNSCDDMNNNDEKNKICESVKGKEVIFNRKD